VKNNKLIVRPATVPDYPAIASILDTINGPKPFEQRKKLWQWRYDANPARTPQIPVFLVGEQDGKIVGVHGFTPIRLKVGEAEFFTACSCDLAVHSAARSAGLKIKLKALSKEISQLPVSMSANELANKITLALGGREVSSGRRKLLKLMKTGGFLRRSVARKLGVAGRTLGGPIGKIVGKPLDSIVAISRRVASFPKIADAKIQNLTQFDRRFDYLWKRASISHPILVVRDSRYLNWRYANYPFSGVESYALVRGEEVLGFGVIHAGVDEDGLHFVALLELFVPKGEKAAFEQLLGETIGRAECLGADYIMTRTLTDEWEEVFRHHGFKVREAHFSSNTYKNNIDIPHDFLAEGRNWYTSLGDGDACYYFE